jgi:hypothetical protein
LMTQQVMISLTNNIALSCIYQASRYNINL